MGETIAQRTEHLEKALLKHLHIPNKRKIKDYDLIGEVCIGNYHYAKPFITALCSHMNLKREVTKVSWTKKTVKLSKYDTVEYVTEISLKNYPTIVMHTLDGFFNEESSNIFYQFMLHCGFSEVDARDVYKYQEAEYFRNPDAYYSPGEMEQCISNLTKIVIAHGVPARMVRPYIEEQIKEKKFDKLEMAHILSSLPAREIRLKKEYRKELNKLKRWFS